jgi:hydroxypyruvate isomerase
MNRRDFVATTLATAGLTSLPLAASAIAQESSPTEIKPFKLKYAPSLGMFRNHAGNDPIDNIKFCYDQGFRAIFENGMMGKSPEEQEKIAKTLADLKMDLGPFVLYADFGKASMVYKSGSVKDMLIDLMKKGVECAKRCNAKTALLVPGRYDLSMEWGYQTANVIDNLRYCMEICEPANMVLVLEPLNPYDHSGLFLTKMPQAYEICRAVNSPCCKIVNDMYHQQITEGNIIPNIDRAWSEIGAFHIGDNPGRKEPTTGEINYRNVFAHIHKKGYQGVLCMEHGISKGGKEGEQALLAAYRWCDDFEV